MTRTVTLLCRSKDALFRVVGTDVLLARAGRAQIDVLSTSAGLAWQLLDTPRRGPDLCDALAALYGIPPTEIERDVSALIDELQRRGWVHEVADVDN
jgi:hypothetical protein